MEDIWRWDFRIVEKVFLNFYILILDPSFDFYYSVSHSDFLFRLQSYKRIQGSCTILGAGPHEDTGVS